MVTFKNFAPLVLDSLENHQLRVSLVSRQWNHRPQNSSFCRLEGFFFLCIEYLSPHQHQHKIRMERAHMSRLHSPHEVNSTVYAIWTKATLPLVLYAVSLSGMLRYYTLRFSTFTSPLCIQHVQSLGFFTKGMVYNPRKYDPLEKPWDAISRLREPFSMHDTQHLLDSP